MALTVQSLIGQRVFPSLKLVAGQKGGDNKICWVNNMDIIRSPDTLQPGELLFTTGYGLNDQVSYHDLIAQLSRREVSGLVIQTGTFLDIIPPYLVEQADSLGFPLMTMPDTIGFSEILHVMMPMFSPSQQQGWDDAAMKQAYSFLTQIITSNPEAVFPDHEDQSVQLMLLEAMNYSNTDERQWKETFSQIRSYIQSHSRMCMYYELPQHRYVFFSTHSPEISQAMLYELNIKLTLLSEANGANYYMGTEYLRSPERLFVQLQHAVEGLSTLRQIKARRGVCSYQSIRFIKMLGNLHMNDSSVVLDNQALQLLLSYDKTNSTNYVQTQRIYLSSSCNMTRTANQLFIHRHTLIKRLSKITAICGLDLEDYYTRIYMSIALMFHDYFIY